MNDLLNLFDKHWYLALYSIIALTLIVQAICSAIVKIHDRFWRHWNIRKHGYPPEHCDSDGDFRKVDNG